MSWLAGGRLLAGNDPLRLGPAYGTLSGDLLPRKIIVLEVTSVLLLYYLSNLHNPVMGGIQTPEAVIRLPHGFSSDANAATRVIPGLGHESIDRSSNGIKGVCPVPPFPLAPGFVVIY